jgi:hypothetical protein
MKKPTLPEGYTEERICAIAEHYERQTDDEAEAEIEAAFANPDVAFVEVPVKILTDVCEYISKAKGAIKT